MAATENRRRKLTPNQRSGILLTAIVIVAAMTIITITIAIPAILQKFILRQ